MGFVCAVLLIHVRAEVLDHTVTPSTAYANVQLIWNLVNSQKTVIEMIMYVGVALEFLVPQTQVLDIVIPIPVNADAL